MHLSSAVQHILPIDGPSWPVVFAVVLVALLASARLGFALGRRRPEELVTRASSQLTTLLAATLGLMSLLLAFSFSIVEDRFEQRRTLIVEEANAIGTAYLRAKLLPEPHALRVQRMLHEYAGLRDPPSQRELDAALARSVELHAELWRELAEVEAREPRASSTLLMTLALNEVIDLHEARLVVTLHQRLPLAIALTLAVVSLFAVGLLGYGFGTVRTHASLPVLGLAAAVAAVLVLVLELDRPGAELIEVSRAALIDTQLSMERDLRALEERARAARPSK